MTESQEGIGTHRGASETSRPRGARLTTVSLEEEGDDFGEMSQHWERSRGTEVTVRGGGEGSRKQVGEKG